MTVDASAAGRVSPLVERAPALDAEGAALARRTARRTSIAAMVANACGVVDVFLLLFFVLPSPPGEPDTVRNLVAASVFVVFSFIVGKVWGERLIRPMVAWLVEGRRPTQREREGTLRLPLVCAAIDG